MGLKQLPLALRNLFFVLLQPGIVAGLAPYLIAKERFKEAFTNPLLLQHYIGLPIFLLGTYIMLHCVVRFAVDGFGTLSPADPTQRLVTSGLYRFSRNPMYVGVMLMLLGEVVFTQSGSLLFYSAIIFISFNLFIAYREEPRLRRDFGHDYETYCKTVRRWV